MVAVTSEEHISPDGRLRLLVTREADDLTLGFHGFPWHTHGDVLAAEFAFRGQSGLTPVEAVGQLISDVTACRVPLSFVYTDGQLTDVVVNYEYTEPDAYQPANEHTEHRMWDGRHLGAI